MGLTRDTIQTVYVYIAQPGILFAAWVWYDARKQGVRKPAIVGWVAGTVLLWVVAFPLYLRSRREYVIVESERRVERLAARALRHAAEAAETAANTAAKLAADAHMVCPHCLTKGTVSTALFTIYANDGGSTRNVYKHDDSDGSSGRTEDRWFDNKRAGELNQARCSTCTSVWEI